MPGPNPKSTAVPANGTPAPLMPAELLEADSAKSPVALGVCETLVEKGVDASPAADSCVLIVFEEPLAPRDSFGARTDFAQRRPQALQRVLGP